MLTYNRAVEMFRTARNDRRKLTNNTYLERLNDSSFGVRLHQTYVVQLHADGTYTLNSGGWRTVTTKDRINNYSPARLSQNRGIWYVGAFLYQDGMKVNAAGQPINPIKPDTAEKKKSKLDRMVRNYIKKWVVNVERTKTVERPGPGDCWGCYFTAKDKPEAMGVEHVLSHLKENYFVPSLLWKALQRCGDPSFVWGMIESEAAQGRARLLERELRSYFRRIKPALLEIM